MLQNDLLTLRQMEDGDAKALFAIYGDCCVMRYTGEEPFPNLQTVDVMLASVRKLLLEGCSLEWAIVLKGTQDVIGTCGLYRFDQIAKSAEVGCLLNRNAWGFGYMGQALSLISHFARRELELKLLLADVALENARAQCLFQRLGYIPVETGYLAMHLGLDHG